MVKSGISIQTLAQDNIVLTSGYSEAGAHEARAEGIDLLPKTYRLEELDAALSAA